MLLFDNTFKHNIKKFSYIEHYLLRLKIKATVIIINVDTIISLLQKQIF